MNHDHSNHNSPDSDIGCLEAIEKLYEWLDGELKDPADAELVAEHISLCQSCYSRAEMEQLLNDRIRKSAGNEDKAPTALHTRLKDVMSKL